jgi:hypothetical protein
MTQVTWQTVTVVTSFVLCFKHKEQHARADARATAVAAEESVDLLFRAVEDTTLNFTEIAKDERTRFCRARKFQRREKTQWKKQRTKSIWN